MARFARRLCPSMRMERGTACLIQRCSFRGLGDTLRRMGERSDIIRLMQRALIARRLDRVRVEQVVSKG